MKKLSGGCTLDCFDACKFNVYVNDNNKVVKIEGDKNHPYTKGFVCKKGLMHLDRMNHEKRQYKPLLKVDGQWKEISFDEAVNIMADKLKYFKNNYGTKSIMYYEQYGNGSLLKSIGDIFMNFFGGCYKQKGGPCWSAGIKAQEKNFGDVRSHSLEDMMNSKAIIVWGKNPAYTSIHTMAAIKKAKDNGSYVIVIDPIETATAKMADCYIRVKPDGDTALALAMGKVIIEEGKCDYDYINKYVNGFEEYEEYVKSLKLDELLEKAGVTKETLNLLIEKYTKKYSTILLGYGLQKYDFGGNTIQLIDVLPAITGQIGESGGGVNYANKVYPGILNTDPYNSEEYAQNQIFQTSKISSFIREENIKMAVITKSNLLNQLPSLNELESAFRKIDFKVCFDMFLTDTAQSCDLFIPTTTVLESEDILYSSMTNPYITYIEKAEEPKEYLMDEYEFFMKVAEKLGIKEYPYVTKKEYLTKVIEPLKKYEAEMSLEYLKKNYFTIHESIAWKDKKFETESGKFEITFYKEALLRKDRKLNNDLVRNNNILNSEDNTFRILTIHSKDALSSQHYMDNDKMAEAYINNKMAEKHSFSDGDVVYLESDEGKIKVQLKVDDMVGDNIVMMYVGWWKRNGNPNYIINSGISDIGGQVTYNETFVRIVKE